MTDLTQRALEWADTFANGMFSGHAELYREELGTLLRAAMREALEEAANAEDRLIAWKNYRLGSNGRWTAYIQGRRDATLAIRALIGVLASEAPIHAANCNISEKLSDICSCGATEPPDPRDAEIERRSVDMPLSDVNSLDAVVHALGIEDSDTTPADAVEGLKAEIERLRDDLNSVSVLLRRRDDLIDDQLKPEIERLRGIVKTVDAELAFYASRQNYLQETSGIKHDPRRGYGTTQAPVLLDGGKRAHVARQTLDRDPTDK